MNLFNRAKGHLAQAKSFLKPSITAYLNAPSAPLFKSVSVQRKSTSIEQKTTFNPFLKAKSLFQQLRHQSKRLMSARSTRLLPAPKAADFEVQSLQVYKKKPLVWVYLRHFFVLSKDKLTAFLGELRLADVLKRPIIGQHVVVKGLSFNGAVMALIGVLCTLVFLIHRHSNLPKVKYGFQLSQFKVVEDKIKQGDIVYSMLVKHGLTHHQADSLLTSIKPSYNFEKIKVGKPYSFLSKREKADSNYLVIEPDAKRYFVFDLKTPSVKEVKRNVSVREFETGGKLKKTLYSSLVESGMSYGLINMVQEALKNKLDIGKCEDGDEYKLIWEEELIDGQSVGINTLKSIYVKGQCLGKPVYAFYFSNGKEKGWFEKDSLPVRSGFLDSPVKNGTITSSFSLNRYHPILHYRRPHYGTDYAAPQGTPIISVADGVVEEARYGGGNGKFIKIKHKNPYETQYLHMSRFAQGIQTGTPVKQKQVIGYVGSTGLATGPHVCFRFSKLGTPINHLKERIFSEKDSIKFENLAVTMTQRLNNMPLLSEQEREEQKKMLLQMRGKK